MRRPDRGRGRGGAERILVGLVAGIALLLCGWTVALAFASLRMSDAYSELRREIVEARHQWHDEASELRAAAASLAVQLDRRSEESLRRIEGLHARRREIPQSDDVLLPRLGELVELNRLLADELLLANRHVAESQRALARWLGARARPEGDDSPGE